MGSIVITGGTGFLGSHLTKRLLPAAQNRKMRIVIIDNSDKISKGQTPGLDGTFVDGRSLVVYEEDIRHKDAISDILRTEKPIDILIHLAARGNTIDSNVKPQEILDININGTRNVLDACSVNNVIRFVFASSAAVYGEAKKLPLSEDHPLLPLSNYALGKAKAEELVSSYMLKGKIRSSISMRIFNVYGKGDHNGVISRFSKRLESGLAPIVYGDGKQIRDFISVNDVTNALLLASNSNEGGEFNIGTGKPVAIDDLARRMIKTRGLDLQPVYTLKDREKNTNHRSLEIRRSYADIRKSSEVLNFTARDNIDSYLREIR